MPTYVAEKLIAADAQAKAQAVATAWGTAAADPDKIKDLRRIVPFEHYAFSGLNYPGLGVGAGIMLASDMPKAFLEEFLSQELIRFDPLNTMSTPQTPWGSWHDLAAADLARPELQAIRVLERRHGIATRSVISLYRGTFRYGGAIFTRATPFTPDEKFILEVAARDIHSDISEAYIITMSSQSGINAGELACLSAVAGGMALEDAALATGYTPDTVTSYIKSATKKLGARNRTHAVAEAMRRRLIS